MMSDKSGKSEKTLKESLAPALSVLRDLGGSIVFSDDSGEEFVIARRRDFDRAASKTERQLSLPSANNVASAIRRHMSDEIAEDVLERINRDIALTHLREQEEIDDLGINQPPPLPVFGRNNRPTPPPIRFEPIKGDLPPELQD